MAAAPPPLVPDVSPSRAELGRRAAAHAHGVLRRALATQARVRVVFACAPSQDEFLAGLVAATRREAFDWSRVDAFHMDEYLGLGPTHPAGFRAYLRRHLLDHVVPGSFSELRGEAADARAEAARYAELLSAAPIDLICLGIGENGHIAFNDPPVADFEDPAVVKVVELDQACRRQQVNDGCFPALDAVPTHALSLTIPVFRQARQLSVVVPGVRKAQAVAATCRGRLATACPASILRTHPAVRLFVDADAASLLAS